MNIFTKSIYNVETTDQLIDIITQMVDMSPYLDRVSIDKFTSDAKWLSSQLTGATLEEVPSIHIFSRFSTNSFIETYREAVYQEIDKLPMNLDFITPKDTVSRTPTEKIEYMESILKQYLTYIYVSSHSDPAIVNRALRLLITMSTSTAYGQMTADESISLLRVTHNYIVTSMNNGTFPGMEKTEQREDKGEDKVFQSLVKALNNDDLSSLVDVLNKFLDMHDGTKKMKRDKVVTLFTTVDNVQDINITLDSILAIRQSVTRRSDTSLSLMDLLNIISQPSKIKMSKEMINMLISIIDCDKDDLSDLAKTFNRDEISSLTNVLNEIHEVYDKSQNDKGDK